MDESVDTDTPDTETVVVGAPVDEVRSVGRPVNETTLEVVDVVARGTSLSNVVVVVNVLPDVTGGK